MLSQYKYIDVKKPIRPCNIPDRNLEELFAQENQATDLTEAYTFFNLLAGGLKILPTDLVALYTGDLAVKNYDGEISESAYDFDGDFIAAQFLSGASNVDFETPGLTVFENGHNPYYDDTLNWDDPLSLEIYQQYVSLEFTPFDLSANHWWETYARPVLNDKLSNKNLYDFIMDEDFQGMNSSDTFGLLLVIIELKRRFDTAMGALFGNFANLGQIEQSTYVDGDGIEHTEYNITYVDDEAMLSNLAWDNLNVDCHNEYILRAFIKIQSVTQTYWSALMGPESYEGLTSEEIGHYENWRSFLAGAGGEHFEHWKDIYETEIAKDADEQDAATIDQATEYLEFYQAYFAPNPNDADIASNKFYVDGISSTNYCFQPYLVSEPLADYGFGWSAYSAYLPGVTMLTDLSDNTNITEKALNKGDDVYTFLAQVEGYGVNALHNSYQENWAMVTYSLVSGAKTAEVNDVVRRSAFNRMNYTRYSNRMREYEEKISDRQYEEALNKLLEKKARAKRQKLKKDLEAKTKKAKKAMQKAAQAHNKKTEDNQNKNQAVAAEKRKNSSQKSKKKSQK